MITFEECGLSRWQGILLFIAAVPVAAFIWFLMVLL